MANREPSNSQSSSLARAPRFPNYPNRLLRGNYASSAQGAQFVQVSDFTGEVQPAGGQSGADATFLSDMAGLAIFGQDFPLIVNLRQQYVAGGAINIATSEPGTAQVGAGVYVTHGAYLGIKGDAFTYNTYATDAVQPEQDHVLTFGSGPTAFSVPGYDLAYQWNALDLADGGGNPVFASLFCDFITGGGVIAGYGKLVQVPQDAGNPQLPVILEASAYTEEIAQNGNVFTSSGVDYVVVGVWDVAPSPGPLPPPAP